MNLNNSSPVKPPLICIGYTNIDENRFHDHTTIAPGGGAYFSAIAASYISQPVGLITRIGYDFDPSFLLSRVLSEGVHIISHKNTTRSIQTYSSQSDMTERDIQLVSGVSDDIDPEDIPAQWITHAQHIHISTMLPDQQKKFIDRIRKTGTDAKISIDTDSYFFKNKSTFKKIRELFKLADMPFANRIEYEALHDVIDQADEAIVKHDKDGADYMKSGKIIFHAAAQSVPVIDTTGAGDMLAGTFLASRIAGTSIEESLQISVNTATRSVTAYGTNHLFH